MTWLGQVAGLPVYKSHLCGGYGLCLSVSLFALAAVVYVEE